MEKRSSKETPSLACSSSSCSSSPFFGSFFDSNSCCLGLQLCFGNRFSRKLRYWLGRNWLWLRELHRSDRFINILDRLRPNPRHPKNLIRVHFHGHHQCPDRINAGFDQNIENVLLKPKLVKRHAKGSSWHFSAGSGYFLFLSASGVFFDLDRA